MMTNLNYTKFVNIYEPSKFPHSVKEKMSVHLTTGLTKRVPVGRSPSPSELCTLVMSKIGVGAKDYKHINTDVPVPNHRRSCTKPQTRLVERRFLSFCS